MLLDLLPLQEARPAAGSRPATRTRVVPFGVPATVRRSGRVGFTVRAGVVSAISAGTGGWVSTVTASPAGPAVAAAGSVVGTVTGRMIVGDLDGERLARLRVEDDELVVLLAANRAG